MLKRNPVDRINFEDFSTHKFLIPAQAQNRSDLSNNKEELLNSLESREQALNHEINRLVKEKSPQDIDLNGTYKYKATF